MLGWVLAIGAAIGVAIGIHEHRKSTSKSGPLPPGTDGTGGNPIFVPGVLPETQLSPGDKVKEGDTVFVRANGLLPIDRSPEKAALLSEFFKDFQAANVQATKALPQADGTILGFIDALPALLDEAQIDTSSTGGTVNDKSDFRNVRFPKGAVISILRNGERIV